MKNKLCFLISILTLITLLGTAATCNLCSKIKPEQTQPSNIVENEAEETITQAIVKETVTDKTEVETTTATTLTEQTIETSADESIVLSAGTTNPTIKQIALTFDAGWEYEKHRGTFKPS